MCLSFGTTTEKAFRAALAGLDVPTPAGGTTGRISGRYYHLATRSDSPYAVSALGSETLPADALPTEYRQALVDALAMNVCVNVTEHALDPKGRNSARISLRDAAKPAAAQYLYRLPGPEFVTTVGPIHLTRPNHSVFGSRNPANTSRRCHQLVSETGRGFLTAVKLPWVLDTSLRPEVDVKETAGFRRWALY